MKIHKVNRLDEETTLCGELVGTVPCSRSWDDVTCKICLKNYEKIQYKVRR